MNISTVFEERKTEFLAQIENAPDTSSRIAAAQLVLEQISCVIAQEELNELMRQRKMAVLAALRRAPSLLNAAGAQGELVFAQENVKSKKGIDALSLKRIGAIVLCVLALAELSDGRWLFALLQIGGCALMLFGSGTLPVFMANSGAAKARGVVTIDAQTLLSRVGELCRAADVCISDLALLEREQEMMRLSGTADEAMIDLLMSMLEAKASGRKDAGERILALAQQYLRMLGMEAVYYDEKTASAFDVLPTIGAERTIRPALYKDGKLIRRGVAAKAMEGGAGA